MAKKSIRQAPNRSSTTRTLIETGTDKRYVKRRGDGTFKESDDLGQSLAVDVRRAANTATKPGHGDQGDVKRPVKRAEKKR